MMENGKLESVEGAEAVGPLLTQPLGETRDRSTSSVSLSIPRPSSTISLASLCESPAGAKAHRAVDSAAAVITALATRSDNAKVVITTCKAIKAMAYQVPESRAILAAAGAIPLIADAMRKHEEVASVQAAACGALWNVAASASSDTVAHVHKLAPLVIAAMQAHVADAELQRSGCGALWTLAMHGNLRTSLFTSGAVSAALAAMSEHSDNAAVQHKAIGLLWNIAKLADLRQPMCDAGVAAAIAAALKQHPTNKTVGSVARNALFCLARCGSMEAALRGDYIGLPLKPLVRAKEQLQLENPLAAPCSRGTVLVASRAR